MTGICRHILTSGLVCSQVAVRGTLYCRHHGTLNTAVAGCRPAPDPYGLYKPLPFVFPEDRASLQLNLFLVLQAFNDKQIDNRSANTMNRLLRSCEINLSKGQGRLIDPSAGEAVERVILTPDGEEIAPPREQLEREEDLPVHGEDCPCRKCAEEFRGAAPEEHHADCRCGLCGAEAEGTARIADARKLYDKEPLKAPAGDADSSGESSCEESPYKAVIRKYEARQAAIEAGILPPPAPKPLDPDHPMSAAMRRYNETLEQVERNKLAAKESWQRFVAREAALGRIVEEELAGNPESLLANP